MGRELEASMLSSFPRTSALSEHANKTGHHPLWSEVKYIDWDSYWYTRRVKETIHIRLHPDNINRDDGIEILEGWIPTIKKLHERPVRQQTAEGTTRSKTSRKTRTHRNNGDRNPPIALDRHDTNGNAWAVDQSPDED